VVAAKRSGRALAIGVGGPEGTARPSNGHVRNPFVCHSINISTDKILIK
jgi:hypothetical protein